MFRQYWYVAALFLFIEGMALWNAVDFLRERTRRVSPPFGLAPLSARITWRQPEWRDQLWRGDRVLAIDGERLRGQAQWERHLQAARPGGTLTVEVEHYPAGEPPWREQVPLELEAMPEPRSAGLAVMWWYLMVVGPAVCALLAAWVMVRRETEQLTDWLVICVLAGAAQASRWGTPAHGLYESAVTNGALFALCVLAVYGLRHFQPKPWVRAVGWSGLAVVALAAAVAYLRANRLSALTLFEALEPVWMMVQPMIPMLVMVAAAIQFALGSNRLVQQGMAALLLSLGLGCSVLPRVGVEAGAAAWFYLLPALLLPVNLARAAVRNARQPAPVSLPPTDSWRTLFDSGAQYLETHAGLRLLALYGPHEDEFVVRAALPSGTWPPVKATPPPCATQTWCTVETAAGRAGYLVVARIDDGDEWLRRSLLALSAALAERMPPLVRQ